MADCGYDVLAAAFLSDGRIVFAARPSGTSNLFVVDPVTGRIAGLLTCGTRARHPAGSRDARWLAFSEDEGGACKGQR